MTYLERYLKGEHEAVWNELIALGEAVRHEPVYSDAKAVAAETMQRSRRNIEKIYERLKSIGYQFEAESSSNLSNPFPDMEKQIKNDPVLGTLFGTLLDNIKDSFGKFIPNLDLSNPYKSIPRRAYNPPATDIVEQLDEYERELGLLPLSVRAWCEIVGDVDFIGDYPNLSSYDRKGNPFDLRGMMRGMMADNPHLMQDLDADVDLSDINTPLPLNQFQKLMREEAQAARDLANSPKKEEDWWVTDPLCFAFDLDIELAREMMEEVEDDMEAFEELEAGVLYAMLIAPDHLHKANISGSTYDIMLPNARVDARLYGTDFYFVAYLRNSFAWGGFPMLADYPERDEKLIEMLKEGLEAI